MKKTLILATIILAIAAQQLAAQSDKTITVTSLEWPPYTGQSLKDLGASSVVAVAAFKAMGYDLKIEFFPWDRAVYLAKTDPKYAGYFPEYWSDDNAKTFIYSDAMGTGPLGFVERKDAPVKWAALDDLKGITIGVVDGYINTPQFDAMVASKLFKADAAPDDATNVVKVAQKRFPIAVIDPNVLNYLLVFDTKTIQYKDALQFNAQILGLKKLYMCFKRGADGEKYAQILNNGLKKINVDKVMKDYFIALGL
jgi:polar amino acid transport system substrate-binding protein